MSRHVHLVGSVPLPDAKAVFTTVSGALGPYLKSIPDGETGERLDWITWLEPVFANHPAFKPSDETFQLHSAARTHTRYGLKPGASIDNVRFDNIFYADNAIASYRVFAELKKSGVIPAYVKFQVDLVPAHSVIWLFVQEDLQAAIPHDQLAIQFDIASAVFARLERNQASAYGADKLAMQENFAAIVARLAERVPADVDLMFHFCYGDAGLKHVVEPSDMGDMLEFANRLSARLKRPIQMIHMPVPRGRADDAYFAPLKGLKLKPGTELCLGLVHYTDGVAGTRARLAAARRFAPEFSIATECGFGRRDPATLDELLRIHADVAKGD